MTKQQKTGLAWLWITLIVLVLDQITKRLALNHLPPYAEVPVMPHFNLTLAYNKGAAFSFLDSASGWQTWIFGLIAISVSIGIVMWLRRLQAQQYLLCIALTMVIGGALGNLIDRLLYGHVVDFLDFYAFNWHWPVFNVADSAICLGAFMLFLDALFSSKKK
jgi:signal peptidase II